AEKTIIRCAYPSRYRGKMGTQHAGNRLRTCRQGIFAWRAAPFPWAAFPERPSTGILNPAIPTMESHHERLRCHYPLDAAARLCAQPGGRLLQPARAPSRATARVCRRLRCRSLSQVAGVHPCTDPFWHTDVGVYARCDVRFLVRWRFSGARYVGTELAPGTHLDGPSVCWPISLRERAAFPPLYALRHVCHRSPLWV